MDSPESSGLFSSAKCPRGLQFAFSLIVRDPFGTWRCSIWQCYAGVSACLQLVIGPLSDRFGRRPVILGALVVFIAATIGCAVAQDAWTFLACRMGQAMIAPTYAVSLAVIRDTTSREQAAGQYGYLAMAWSIAPILGPTLGGLLDQALGWRASLFVLALFGFAALALCWSDLRETNSAPSNTMVEQYRTYPAAGGWSCSRPSATRGNTLYSPPLHGLDD